MKSYKYKLTPLTPIHIGNGDSLEPYEYIIKNNYLYKFDVSVLYNNVSDVNKGLLKDSMLKNAVQLRQRVNKFYKEDYGYTAKIPTSIEIQNLYTKNLDKIGNQLLIQQFICSMDKEYIAGSTIKGAIRSAIVHSEGAKRKDIDYEIAKKPRIILVNGREMADIDKKYFNYGTVQEDPFKTVKVSDTVGELSLGVGQVNVHTVKDGTFNKGVPMYLVCALGKLQDENVNSVSGTLTLSDEMLSKISSKYKKLTLQDIIKASWDKADAVIKAEKAFYMKANFLVGQDLYERLDQYFDKVDKTKCMPIRMGRGCGMDSTTLNLVNKNRTPKTDPKSRMLFENKFPMGWGVIEFVE
ncbi:MAG: type III-A CRISPR-associated RAMP protein Csm5 [Epulopiscium sp. Nele67-Bin004]|nr:MAG: type III-A CRISPR-associated RAMP protein Csm5 [Epulopiscium sp. Nele67-Bin004]